MVISPLSGFTAIPNPQMLAFMGAQSFIMMYQAGEGWQYGKRRISAMSNEEFNVLTPELVLEKQAVVLKNSLATIQDSMNAMTPLVGTIVAQYGDFIREFIKALPQLFQNIGQESETPQQALLPGVPGFITPVIPLVPRPGTSGGTPVPPRAVPQPIIPTIYSLSLLRSMSLSALLELRRTGNITAQSMLHLVNVINEKTKAKRAVPAPVRDATETERIINEYFAKKSKLFKEVMRLIPLTRRKKSHPSHLTRLKAEYYRFMSISRNSPIHQIKIDATQGYRHRFPKV